MQSSFMWKTRTDQTGRMSENAFSDIEVHIYPGYLGEYLYSTYCPFDITRKVGFRLAFYFK